MNSKKRILTGLMALALLVVMNPVNQAEAGIRVRAAVTTPHITVRVNTPAVHVTAYKHLRPTPQRRGAVVVVSKQDRRIARRLAKFTGSQKQELLQLHSRGYSWQEIGRMLNLRPQMVRAAMSRKGWERYQHGGRPVKVVRCGTR